MLIKTFGRIFCRILLEFVKNRKHFFNYGKIAIFRIEIQKNTKFCTIKNSTMAKKTINVKGTEITVFQGEQSDYISLTDIARYKDANNTDDIIKNWLRNRNTLELLGFWELMYNSDFKPVEFDGFRKQAGLNSFVLTPKKWLLHK